LPVKEEIAEKKPHPTVKVVPNVTAAADGAVDAGLIPGRKRRNKAGRDLFQLFFLLLQFSLDMAAVTGGFLIAYQLRAKIPFGGLFIPFSPENYPIILSLSVGALMFSFYYHKLYRLKRGYSKIDEFYRICAATVLGLILTLALNSIILGPTFQYSRQILIYSMVFIIVLTALVRLIFGGIVSGLRKRGAAQIRMVLVGTGEATQRILRKVSEAPELGYKIIGVLTDDLSQNDSPTANNSNDNLPILGQLSQLRMVVVGHEVDEVIVTVSGANQDHLLDLVDMCDDLPVSIKIYPDAFQLITTNEVTIGDLTGLPLVNVKDVSLRGINRVVKRIMDIALSAAFLIVASPLMFICALLIKITDPRGPVFFTQERVGLDGNPFTVIKYRTMRVDSEADGPGWTTANDPRRTAIGKFMRRYSLDELPQFINVLLGDMSIVGPRPEQVFKVEEFSQIFPRYMRRHKEKAGITGWAQVNGLRGDTSIAERIRYDLYYVENWSVLFDLKIMLKTIIVIFTDKSAY